MGSNGADGASRPSFTVASQEARGATPPESGPRIEPPHGLEVHRFVVDGEQFALLEWPNGPAGVPPGMTRAESEVLALLVAGLTNSEIARRRGRSERTVANQVQCVFRRLGVGSRHELFALLAGSRRTGGNGR